MAYRVTLIPGDGIGPELVEAGRRVLEATGVEFDWDVQLAGSEIMEQEGTPLPQRVIDSIRQNKVALKGPITTPIGTGFRSVNVALRHELDLYACIRPCKSYAGVQSARYQNIDLVVVRENTEDLYAGVEFEANSSEAKEIIAKSAGKINPDAAISIKPISASGSRRIIKHAFDYAVANGRKKVTAIAKANIMKFTDGLFFEVGREVAKEYPDIEYEERLIDNMCMQLGMHPENYDVLVLPNLYGDIISDLCAGLVGGLGLAPGANIGEKGALFEPTHGSAPKYKGLNKANPTAFILSGVMMLRHLKEFEAAERVERAIAKVIEEGKNVTYDLKADRNAPTAVGTQEMADAIIAAME